MPARRLPWFKLWPEAMRHEKIALLSDSVFRTWVSTLASGSEQATRWRFASVKHLVSVTARPEADVRELIAAHLLDISSSGEVWVHDWRQWQERYASDFTPRTPPNGSANTPRTLRDDSANAAPSLRPELRGEIKSKRETGELTHPKSFPPSGKDFAADAAGRTRKRDPRPTIVPDDVRSVLAGLPTDLGAAAFHDQAVTALESVGFTCDREVFVGDRGDGQRGRLDIVAERDGVRIAFELDDRTPREKSVTKLLGVTDAARVVVLRCPYGDDVPHRTGIDAVIAAGNPGRRSGRRRGEPSPAPSPEVTAPLTPADELVWSAALAVAAADMSEANGAMLVQLQPVGRSADGALQLRAPPGYGLERFRGTLARALLDAGDSNGPHVMIFEG